MQDLQQLRQAIHMSRLAMADNLLSKKVRIINKTLFGVDNQSEWKTPDELLAYLKDIAKLSTDEETKELSQQLVDVLSYFMGKNPRKPLSVNVSETATYLAPRLEDYDGGKEERDSDLIKASSDNDIKSVEELLKQGANANTRNIDDRTPLMLCAIYKTPDVAKALIEAGANVNAVDKEGNTPLIWAAIYDNAEVAKVLIEHGANVGARNKEGNTAMKEAQVWGCSSVMAVLKPYQAQ